MSYIEQSLKDHAVNLFKLIENKVVERLQLFCQWRLTMAIEEEQERQEIKRLNEYSCDIIEKIKEGYQFKALTCP